MAKYSVFISSQERAWQGYALVSGFVFTLLCISLALIIVAGGQLSLKNWAVILSSTILSGIFFGWSLLCVRTLKEDRKL